MQGKRSLVTVFRIGAKSTPNPVPPARRRIAIAGVAILGILLAVMPARAQLNSNIAGVNLAANLATSLTVTASPGLVNFALIPNGTASGSVPITVNTSWTLRPNVGGVTVYAYFTSAAAALTDGAADNIPSSKVSGSVNGGAFGAFTGASPFAAGSSITLSNWPILGNNRTGNHTDTLNLNISTTGLSLPAGTYTGVLNIQAQAL
jgi:hypothetical protein